MKKLIVLCLLLAVSFIPLFGQGMPVLDVANLVQSIENVYQFGVQIENTIEQVKAQYEAIEQAYQQMMGMNWDDLSNLGDSFKDNGANPMDWIRDTRNATQTVLSVVNENMNLVNRLEDELAAETISFGGMDVSFLDLIGLGREDATLEDFFTHAMNTTGDSLEELAEIWAGGLSYEEREHIMKQYGMSPKNYATWKLAGYEFDRILNDCIIKGTTQGIQATAEECTSKAVQLVKAMNEVPEGSTYAQQQLLTSGLADIELILAKIIGNFGDFTGLYANQLKTEMAHEEAKNRDLKETYEQAKSSKAVVFSDEINILNNY